MRFQLIVACATVGVAFLAHTLAHGQASPPPVGQISTQSAASSTPTAEKSVSQTRKRPANTSKPVTLASRTAACKLDCSSGNLHGTYRAYGAADPQLKSPESKKLYAECVRLCLDPLPGTYAQKVFVENGASWFGKTMTDCLGCHAAGKPKRWWPGVNTLPDNLKRTPVQ
jgi:hypothetical protein